MGFNQEGDQGGEKDTKAEFEIWTLEILWEERRVLLQKMSFPMCLGIGAGWERLMGEKRGHT